MAKYGLYGAVLLIIAPHTFISTDTRGSFVRWIYGFFYVWTQIKIGTINRTSTQYFETNWFDNGNIYELVFGNFIGLAMFVIVLSLTALILSLKQQNKVAGILLIISGVLLLFIRYMVLKDNNSFFIDDAGGVKVLEIPIGALVGLIFGFLSILKNKK